MIAFVGNDLMFQSKISHAVQVSGGELSVERNPDQFSPRSQNAARIELILVDLGLPNLDIANVVPKWRAQYPQTQIIGYAAHVNVEQMEQASAVGLDAVLTRGQMDRNLVQIIQASLATK